MKHFSSKYYFDDYAKLFIILLALFSPILVNSYNYIDDYGRSLYGYNGLDANGRPVAAIILWMTMWFGDVVDISPIPQIISVALIAASACLLKVSLERHTGYK
ncbi:glucosyltransferase domain-containing protein, partial [Enterobacter hormaechei]|nr:glucosyltransferase domain-containing protein [Enterobacter hormaechei]